MAEIEVPCPSCGTVARFQDMVPFRAECERCAADLHACATCRFHDRYAENECRETEADPVATKDRRNLCEYWKPRAGGGGDERADEARRKLEALFGGAPKAQGPSLPMAPPQPSSSSSAADEAKRKLEELFKKKP